MPNNDPTLLAAFNAAAKALEPTTEDAAELLGAINHLVDALTAYTASVHVGDQTITLTGDVTGSGTGAFAATIGSNKVTGPKIAASALKLLVFTGIDASGAPALATLTGAAVGDAVVGAVNLTDGSSATASFETTISTINKINQLSSNLSAKTLLVLLITKG
jgi:hypothetical protein